jgi:hypothetical protein
MRGGHHTQSTTHPGQGLARVADWAEVAERATASGAFLASFFGRSRDRLFLPEWEHRFFFIHCLLL